ncbi:AAA family ATPase [Thermococcus sp.]
MRLKKLIVKNFKSLHDCEIELGKFNVLIGVNASGKSNLVEIFKLLRKIYVEKDSSPFLEWWGYNNVVWQRKEELPITIGMLFDVEGYDVYFDTTFTGTGGRFRILKEVLDVLNYVRIEKEGSLLTVKYDEEFLDSVLKGKDLETFKTTDSDYVKIISFLRGLMLSQESFIPQKSFEVLPHRTLFSLVSPIEPTEQFVSILFSIFGVTRLTSIKKEDVFIITPLTSGNRPLLQKLVDSFVNIFETQVILLPFVARSIMSPKFPRKETSLNEDASNLIPLLYNIWLHEGKLPEEIAEPLSITFPNTRVFFQLMEDGRVTMKVFENGLELAPPSISDGFYKVLALLTAVYLKPPLLIIDEIENSLHPETLELILDTIKESDVQAIITTHSPVVVDMTEPADLILVDKEQGETKFKRIREPEKIKKFLQERGLALSEGWLYGSIFENNESH